MTSYTSYDKADEERNFVVCDDDDDDDDNNDGDDNDDYNNHSTVRSFPCFFTEYSYPTCKFYVQNSGCRYGSECRFKHLTETGECRRCGERIRLIDLQTHCEVFHQYTSRSRRRKVIKTVISVTSDWDVDFSDGSDRSDNGAGSSNSSSNSSSSSSPSSYNTNNVSASDSPAAAAARNLWKADKVCLSHVKGACLCGLKCSNLHMVNNRCVLCGELTSISTLVKHLQSCPEYKTLQAEIAKANDVECPICFNKLCEIPPISSSSASSSTTNEGNKKRDSSNRLGILYNVDRFGLLPDCRHLFCLNCIMSWRKECDESANLDEHLEGRYSCPVCRKKARFVIPCNRVIQTEQRCAREKEIFAHFLRPCRFFKEGMCRNGSSCNLAHVANDGLPVAPSRFNEKNERSRSGTSYDESGRSGYFDNGESFARRDSYDDYGDEDYEWRGSSD